MSTIESCNSRGPEEACPIEGYSDRKHEEPVDGNYPAAANVFNVALNIKRNGVRAARNFTG